MSSDTKLTMDEECESVDIIKYKGMIGSLLYLTTSRPDIMFSACLMHASKRILKPLILKRAQNVLACALFSEIVKSLGASFDLSPRQKAVVECLRAPHAQNFLTVIPIEGLGQHMSALEYRTILKELPGFKYMHDLVSDVLHDVLKRAGISSKKEAPVNFLTDPLEGRSTLRPADILVFGWAGGKHACVDLTGVSPLVGFRENGFVAGQAALKAESSKVAKHEKACLENQHVFIPFAFDTFGFLAPETEKFLNRVQRVVQSNCSTPKTQNFIFSRIGFAIQKRVAAQLVARLPAILL
nr:putative reverse transcriptase domain-containing protein [Tanacetum cinerariifolium]